MRRTIGGMTSHLARLAVVFVLCIPVLAADPTAAAGKLRWRLGVQAYTFRSLTFFEAIDQAAAAGIEYIEMYPGQRLSKDQPNLKTDHNLPDDVQEQIKKKLAEAKVKLVNYGVVGLGKDEAAARKVFEFARKMGIETIVSEPAPADLAWIDRLCQEYEINVALHNHPKPSRYWDPQVVLDACKGRSPRIGACADTGHWMRSGLDPLECLRKLEGRIICLHFKDLNAAEPKAHDVPWGTGKGQVYKQLEELKRQNKPFVFSIEYEHNTPELAANVGKCAQWFYDTCTALAGK